MWKKRLLSSESKAAASSLAVTLILITLLVSCADPPPQVVSPCAGLEEIPVGSETYEVGSARWMLGTTRPDNSRIAIPADFIESRPEMSILQPALSKRIDVFNEWFRKNCPQVDRDQFLPAP